jgi:hypothetical protein
VSGVFDESAYALFFLRLKPTIPFVFFLSLSLSVHVQICFAPFFGCDFMDAADSIEPNPIGDRGVARVGCFFLD